MAVQLLAHVPLDPERLAARDDAAAVHEHGLRDAGGEDRGHRPGEERRAALLLDPVDRDGDEHDDSDCRSLREHGEHGRHGERALVRPQEPEEPDERAPVRDVAHAAERIRGPRGTRVNARGRGRRARRRGPCRARSASG